jgi:isoleucyl-tRNA synthetase
MGELYRETQQNLLELTLWERLVKVFFKMLVLMATILSIDIEEMMEKLMQSDQTSKQLLAMLRALEEFEDNVHNNNKPGDCLAVA